MSSEIARRILELSEQVGSLRYGDFTLSSGAKSSYYFDGRLISLHPEGAHLLGRAFMQVLQGSGIVAVGGPATAAIPIVTSIALVSQIEGSPLDAFFVRGEAKEYGTRKQVEGRLQAGSRVAILDDVCSTGGSLFMAISAVEEAGCTVERVLTILDRNQGGGDELRSRGYDFRTLLEADAEGRVRVAE